jgi:hypothetical protein
MKQIVRWAWGWCVVCGSCWGEVARAPGDPPLRGVLRSPGPSIHAVRTGPALIHVYSPFTGAGVFVAPSVTGGDTDCAIAATNRAAFEPILPDRRETLSVAAGQVACVAVSARRGAEVLWHAHEELGPPAPLVGSLSAGALR